MGQQPRHRRALHPHQPRRQVPYLSFPHVDNRLKEQFSRLQYTRNSYSSPPTHAITRLTIPLKHAARDAYYTDIIGNVSTSRYRPGRGTADSHLEIQPRYPVYGGWNYTFRLGWNVDLEKVQRISGTERILRVPFLEGAENVQYKKFDINIILPEGARYPLTLSLLLCLLAMCSLAGM